MSVRPCVYDLFNDVVSSYNYVASNRGIIVGCEVHMVSFTKISLCDLKCRVVRRQLHVSEEHTAFIFDLEDGGNTFPELHGITIQMFAFSGRTIRGY
jgi:hypothetical protein